MSQSAVTAVGVRQRKPASDGPNLIEAEGEIQNLLSVIDDADCRVILEETSDDSLSARELSNICDIPLSTVYRKIHQLTETGLLQERTRLCRSGKHSSEYSRGMEKVVVSVDADTGVQLQVSRREQSEQSLDPLRSGGW